MKANFIHGLEPLSGKKGGYSPGPDCQSSWFCVRTQPRREMLALNSLKVLAVESFFPRIRFRGTGRYQGRWFTEPLFPNYLFCRFNLKHQSRTVRYAPGISSLIQFGYYYPVVPLELILELQATFSLNEPAAVVKSFNIGDQVVIEIGPLQGCEAVVDQVLPGKGRVSLLLEFLGRQTRVETNQQHIQFPAGSRVFRLESACVV